MWSPRYAILITAILLCAGCAKRPPEAYRLAPESGAHILIPPGIANGTVTLPVARKSPCAPAATAGTVERRGSKLRIVIDRARLLQQPAGWLRQWTTELEAQGCVPPGTGMEFARRILESVPLDPAAAYRLLHGENVSAGYLELGPENRLQTQAPILKSGASPDADVIEIASVTGTDRALNVDVRESEERVGVETSWYALRPKPEGPGTTIVPLSAERRIDDKIEKATGPLRNYFPFAPEIGFYRLIYKADIDGRGSVTEIVVGAPDRIELERRTRRVLDDFDTCKVSDASLCEVIPRHVALNAVMAVTVNGMETRLGIRGNVRTAIRQAGGPQQADDVLPTLRVRKPYGGKLVDVQFDRASHAILDLTLLGGESIDFRQ